MLQSDLQAAFLSHFGHAATHLVEAPGRVNLIGDHTDYNDLPVLPMALRQRVRMVVRPRDDEFVHILPLATGLEPTSFALGHDIVSQAAGHWSNYARGAGQVVTRYRDSSPRGFDAVVASDIPIAAGLSSSSALVVAVMLALVRVACAEDPSTEPESAASKLELAVLAAQAEQYVGTAGGGMDQAASLCGEAGHALFMRFAPLRVTPLAVPPAWRFIVAHSGEVAEKSGALEAEYNERVASCRQALERMQGELGATQAATYPALMENFGEQELLSASTASLNGVELKRFRHTASEALRVEAAVKALIDEDATRFGELMLASHESLARDYEVSTDVLNEMVEAAVAAGAFGARVTGAGFGGSVVALAHETASASVLSALTALVATRLQDVEPTAFVAVASDGARVTPLREL